MLSCSLSANDKKSNNLADSPSLIWKRMKKKTTQRLPPDEDSLKFHIKRCNYVAHVFLTTGHLLPFLRQDTTVGKLSMENAHQFDMKSLHFLNQCCERLRRKPRMAMKMMRSQ